MKIEKVGLTLFIAIIGYALIYSPQTMASHHDKRLDEKLFYKAHMMKSHQDEIGLSDEQVNQIKSLKKDVKKYLIEQEAKIEVIKVDIKSMLYERPINTAAIHPLIDQKYELKKAKAKYLVDSMAKLKGILSDEQYAKMKSLKKNMMKKYHH